MHFVKKLPTTDEQKAKTAKEHAVKLKIYTKLREQIFEKRKKGEFDAELLSLTAKLLEKNPDIYTFWNIRREVLDILSQKSSDETNEEYVKRKDDMFHVELLLTEVSLKENCKSYGAWFHRFWSLKQISKPNIAEELKACEKFLQMDGRNFHCWDHRREVAKFGAQQAKEELSFSDRLINANFSNYSSWHYRSSLLPSLFPDPEKELTVERQVLDNEYKKLENAFFTDPEDQSAWIFAEWLLLSDPKRRKCDINDVHVLGLIIDVNRDQNSGSVHSYLSITFDRAVKRARIGDFLLITLKNGKRWIPSSDETSKRGAYCASISYRYKITDELIKCQLRPALNEPYVEVDVKEGYANSDEIYHLYHIKRKPVGDVRRSIIEKVLNNSEELLKELKVEEKKEILKWPLFTYTLALLELNPLEEYETILANLHELAKNVDPQRYGMYMEMAINLRINEKLRQKCGDLRLIDFLFEKRRNGGGDTVGELKLNNLGLKSTEHLKYLSLFVTHLDLTGNKITNLEQFKIFHRLTHLRLDRNPIASLKSISLLPPLDYLSVAEISVDNLDSDDKLALEKVKTLQFSEAYVESPESTG